MKSEILIVRLFSTLILFALFRIGQCQDEPFRLPGDISPLGYEIHLRTNLADPDFNFWGTSLIEVECSANTQQIILHYKELIIIEEEVTVTMLDGENLLPVGIQSHEYNDDFEFYIINLSETLVAGNQYSIYLSYSGVLNTAGFGFTRNSYVVEETGETMWVAASYTGAALARRIHPCFDEPAMKAIFSLTLSHSDIYQSVSNMPIIDNYLSEEVDGWMVNVFDITPPISTNILAFCISQFQPTDIANYNIPIRLWAPEDIMDQLVIIQEAIPFLFTYYEEFFAFPYPLPKLDIVVVPGALGSMEGLGCLLMDDSDITRNPATALVFRPGNILAGMAQYIFHEWWSAIVTKVWWHEMWLTDGFGYYFKELGVQYYWGLMEYVEVRAAAFHRFAASNDAIIDTEALIRPIEDPTNLMQNIVPIVSMFKSFFVVRMMHLMLSPDVFLLGLQYCLQTFQYGVASQSDLMNILNEVSYAAGTLSTDMDMNVIMDEWTHMPGYPVVSVSVDYTNQVATLSQTRFLSQIGLTDAERQSVLTQCWSIPITYTTSVEPNFYNLIPEMFLTCDGDATITLENLSEQDWLLVNLRLLALIRVNYDLNTWNLLTTTLFGDFTVIATLNRVQLLSDSFELAWPGFLPYSIPINMAPYLISESEEGPWRITMECLKPIRERVKQSTYRPYFLRYVRSFLEPKYLELGPLDVIPDLIPNEILLARMKVNLQSSACRYEIPACLEESVNLFNLWMETPDPDTNNPIDNSVLATVYCYGVQEGTTDSWNFLFDRYTNLTPAYADNKYDLIMGLGCSKDPAILQQLLSWSLDPNKIQPYDMTTFFSAVMKNEQPMSSQLVLDFLGSNMENIFIASGEYSSNVCSIILEAGSIVDTEQQLLQLQGFIDAGTAYLADCQSSIDSALRAANSNLTWHVMHDAELIELLGG